jgi:hypothetical protein
MKKLKMIVEKTSSGYSAYSEKFPVFTTGSNIADLMRNAVEAFNFYFRESGEKVKVDKSHVDFSFSIPSFFELYPINVRHFASRIGMNYTLLSQYVQGRKKPSEKQTEKIVHGLQEIGRELSNVYIV